MSELSHIRARRLIQQAHLSEQERVALKTHLEGCEACQQYAAMHVYLSRHLQLEPVRVYADSAFRTTLLRQVRSQHRRYQIMKSVKVLAGIAILAAVAFMAWFFLNPPVAPEPVAEMAAATPAPPTATLARPTATPILPLAASSENILGIWQNQSNLFLYLEDGTYHGASYSLPRAGVARSRVEDDPDWWGEYWFEGTQLFIQETGQAEGVPQCAETIVGIYEVRMLENGHLDYVVIDDKCAFRRRHGGLSGNHESRP